MLIISQKLIVIKNSYLKSRCLGGWSSEIPYVLNMPWGEARAQNEGHLCNVFYLRPHSFKTV